MDTPLISVIIPLYNTEKYIATTIESILQQTISNWELIIVNDASSDNSEQVVSKYLKDKRIKYFNNKQNLGPAGNYNRAFSLATGKYIAIQDSDDVSLPNRLERGLQALLIGNSIVPI